MTTKDQSHNRGQVSTCNICKANIETETSFNCMVRVVCIKCHNSIGHVNELHEFESSNAIGDPTKINPQGSKRTVILRCVGSLEHACECRDDNCRLYICRRMRTIVSHANTCERKESGSCAICKHLIPVVCYHNKDCQETKCPVPFCMDITYKLKEQQMAKAQILKRRIGAASAVGMSQGMSNTGTLSSSAMQQGSNEQDLQQLLTSFDSLNLNNQGQGQVVYTCNNCKSNIETRFHCTVCVDFDLCIKCHNTIGHVHEMQRLGFELGGDVGGCDQKHIDPMLRRFAILRCISCLEHTCQCRNDNCWMASCRKMKSLISHANTCKGNGGCIICKQFIALVCYHAKDCQETKCPIPFCLNVKYKRRQQRMAQARILKRRVAARAVGIPQGMSNPERFLLQCVASLEQLDLK